MDMYEKLMAGNTIRVKIKHPVGKMKKTPFRVAPLWMIGDFYVTESSEWKRFARIGGITINGRKKHAMSQGEMQVWCQAMEEV